MKRLQRDNAARAHKIWKGNNRDVIQYDYIQEEIAARLVDRLDDIKREEGFCVSTRFRRWTRIHSSCHL
jgi:hypothetical protein